MFSIFSNPSKKLQKQHEKKLEQAMHAQRNGDMRAYAQLSVEAEQIHQQWLALQQSNKA